MLQVCNCTVISLKLLVGTTPSLPFGQPAPSKGARGSLSSWAGSVDALPGEKLPGDARGTSRRAAAPNLKQSGCGAAAWTSTACSPAPNAAQSVVKKRLLVPFPRTEKEPAGGMTRRSFLPGPWQKKGPGHASGGSAFCLSRKQRERGQSGEGFAQDALRVGTKALPCTSFVQSQVPAQPPRSLDSPGLPLRLPGPLRGPPSQVAAQLLRSLASATGGGRSKSTGGAPLRAPSQLR